MIPRNTPPKIPHSTQPTNSTECPRRGQRRCGHMYVWYWHLNLGRHLYKHNDRSLCAYACIYLFMCTCAHVHADTHTHTHTHTQRNGTQPPEGNEISQSAGTWRDLYCTDHVADHALITWLIMHWYQSWSYTSHVTDHALIIRLTMHWSSGW